MMTRPVPRVVVTGLGVVSAMGWGRTAFWDGICSGKVGIGDFARFDHKPYRTHIAAEVPDVPTARALRGDSLALADHFAITATAEALEHAGLGHDLSQHEAGLFSGSSTGGMFETEEFYLQTKRAPDRRHDLRLIASQLASSPGNATARRFRFTGPVHTVSSACASGALAVGLAFDAIREGQVEMAVAGGADSLCRITYGGFNSMRSVDTTPCVPFRAQREGLSLGEGGAALVLEKLDNALARGATPLAELVGTGGSSDAHHMTAPDPAGRGAAAALRQALETAGLPIEDIGFVNTHGTGTERNDVAEWNALLEVFGDRARDLPVTSTKGCVGHLLGSAGTIESVATVLCCMHQRVHPTPGPGEVDRSAPVNLVRDRTLDVTPLKAAASLNLGFGGCNGAVVFSRWSD